MHRHQRPGDRQTNAETGFRAIVCTGRLREDFEKRGNGARFKTHAIVLDRHGDGRGIAFDVQPDMAAIGCVLYGVVKQVGHHLRDPCQVATEKESARLLVDYLNPVAALRCSRRIDLDGAIDRQADVENLDA
jgi:hypothetical protein